MAGSALLGRRFIEEHILARDQPGQLVALRTPYVLMSTAQRKRRPQFVIEE